MFLQNLPQVDDKSHRYLLLQVIIVHENDETALGHNSIMPNISGSCNPIPIHMTKAWKICCQWADNSTSWEDLKDLKESHPFQVAQCIESYKLLDEPAFACWAKETLKRSKRICTGCA
jgi:hypothetical protein